MPEMAVGGVWIRSEEGVEEGREERGAKRSCEKHGVDFKLRLEISC
jgi:hypothetical protein